MRIIVVGGGIAGLGTALACARDGHQVTVLERDDTPMPPDADAAFAWQRTGAPQVRHSHAFLARLRNLLRDRAPDVLDALLARGRDRDPVHRRTCRRRSPISRPVPATTSSSRSRAGAPRSSGCCAGWCSPSRASSSATAPPPARSTRGPGAIPRVVGVDGARADLVVDARGPRSSSADWLAAIGAAPVREELHESGIVYFSRFYRVARPASRRRPTSGPTAADLGYLKYAIFLGDNRTFSITYAIESDDEELRRALAAPDGFETVAAVARRDRAVARRRRGRSDHRRARHGRAAQPVPPARRRRRRAARARLRRGRRRVGVHEPALRTRLQPRVRARVRPGRRVARARRRPRRARRVPSPRSPTASSCRGSARRCCRTRRRARCTRSCRPTTRARSCRPIFRDGLLPGDAHVARRVPRVPALVQPAWRRPTRSWPTPRSSAEVLAAYQDRENRPGPPVLGPDRDGVARASSPDATGPELSRRGARRRSRAMSSTCGKDRVLERSARTRRTCRSRRGATPARRGTRSTRRRRTRRSPRRIRT